MPMGDVKEDQPSENGNAGDSALEEKLDVLRKLFNKRDEDQLRIVGVGAGAWGSVFIAQLQNQYGHLRKKVDIRIWRRPGKALSKEFAEQLFSIISGNEDVMRRLIRSYAYAKYAEARLGVRTLYADEILKDGFCVNMVNTPLCPLNVVTHLQEATYRADIVINGLPSTETRKVFEEIGNFWRERQGMLPVVISLAKGVECVLQPHPHILTPCMMIHQAAGLPLENCLYLGGPNIAAEVYDGEYANARLCGADKWRKPLAEFVRQRNFAVWDNSDLITHEVMGGLKNVYAIGAGLVAAVTQESATSKAVYFAHCTSEMIFITHLLAEKPERLAGPLLADTYVTLLKGRNAWYGLQLGNKALTPEMGENIPGKGMIQGISAVGAFYDLLSHSETPVENPETGEKTQPIELCPILKTLHRILHTREADPTAILEALRDKDNVDPSHRIMMTVEGGKAYNPALLATEHSAAESAAHAR
ncbi:NAD-dependent Glycerol-3-Phosphate Dehydrogenase [Klebsormidium nitens]|uniref:Glycerol-3-phosphate dehydrogenase [NAD(+)] n=1 Tax=Klebsormidium nitens TaxID=105231 RepID=A0A1Y1HX95_KLENI|nr:NAD-dependent Glycerol-3-Phosphate Dehydrogenase [Klebsormidium nitens]|eukprot:GAQ81157.1 NAD-dependent Glycerol-3-Phosphate Dehydrogenase [Klebsormidium nitens]